MEILLRQGMSTHRANRIADELVRADLRTEDKKEVNTKQINLFDTKDLKEVKTKKMEK